MKAKTVTGGEAGRAESLQAEGRTAPVRSVLQGESLALPYLVDRALHLDQLEQVDVNALQVLVAAVGLQDDCGGFA